MDILVGLLISIHHDVFLRARDRIPFFFAEISAATPIFFFSVVNATLSSAFRRVLFLLTHRPVSGVLPSSP
jgi:hypothetical protein